MNYKTFYNVLFFLLKNMKARRILSFVLAFVLSFSVLLCPLNVQAGGGGASREPDQKVDDWSWFEKFLANSGNIFNFLLADVGVIANPTKWGSGQFRENYIKFLAEDYLIDNSQSVSDYKEFLMNHVYFSGDSDGNGGFLLNNNLNIKFDPTISESINAFAKEFVEANSIKYRIFDTADFRQINPSAYNNKIQYDKAQALFKKHENDLIMNFSTNINTSIQVVKCDSVLCFYFSQYKKSSSITSGGIFAMDQDYTSYFLYDAYKYNNTDGNYALTHTDESLLNGVILDKGFKFDYYESPFPFSYKNGKSIMVFDSREHAVDWITGHRDIYTTSGYGNYSGNSIRITGDQLKDSFNTYNVVNNTVNNYYENGGGFTDEQVQDIIDAIVESLKGAGGSGGSGNGDDVSGGNSSGGSSGGLGGFLDGLGSVLDAILAIAGKLLEYVGKAIQLFTDVIMKVIDVIPKNFTEFLSAIFPFLPEECFIAIELMLALSVILIIINFFKK